MSKIPFIKPKFPSADDISSDYEAIVDSNWFTNFGPYERELCRQVASFLDHDVHVATTANATLALDLASRLLFKSGIKKQILVPSFTFVAGPAVLIDHGLTPVFLDIDKDSLQPNIDQAKEYIASHVNEVGGILLCNIFGVGNQKIDAWEQLANEFGLPLVIDSAAGFGSCYTQDEYIGARGDCEIFSLHATKPFSVGEGGLLVSKDAVFIEKVRSLENFGFDDNRNITAIGTNAKLQELNCAIGIRQLARLSDRLLQRQESLRIYKDLLTPKGYRFQDNDELSTVAFVSAIAPTKEAADRSEIFLKSNEIEVKKYYAPLHRYSLVRDAAVSTLRLDNTDDIADRILSLPLHDEMDRETVERICRYIVGTQENNAQ